MNVAKCRLSEGELNLINMQVAQGLVPVGVDLAARVFQVCYYDLDKKVVKNFQLTREKFFDFLRNPPFEQKMLVGFEACGACNYCAREIKALGHQYKIMPTKAIKAFLQLAKTDKIDALGIFKGTFTPSINTISARDEQNQTLLNLLGIREQLSKQLVQTGNNQRAMLYELGVVCNEKKTGVDYVIKASEELLEKLKQENSPAYSSVEVGLEALRSNVRNIEAQIKNIEQYLLDYAKSNEDCKNLMSIPGFGALSAVILHAVMGDVNSYPSSRHFAAFAGFAPRVSGSGGKVTVGEIVKTGNRHLKKVLYMCAVARLAQNKRQDHNSSSRISELLGDETTPKKKIICSIANRLARVAWTVVKNKEPFNQDKCRLLSLPTDN